MLKCVLFLPSDCVCVRYCNEIISIINKIILQSRGRIVHCVVAKRPGGETSRGRTDEEAKGPVTVLSDIRGYYHAKVVEALVRL